MSSNNPRQHWILDALRRSGVTIPPDLSIAGNMPAAGAWGTVARALRMEEEDIARILAKQYKLSVASFDGFDQRVLKILPESLARQFMVMPLRETERQVTIATSDPLNYEAEQSIGFATGRAPTFEITHPSAILEAIEQYYSPDGVVEALLGSLDSSGADSVEFVDSSAPDQQLGEQELTAKPVVRLTNLILQTAINDRSSDIHIEPGRTGGVVRVRIDGVLRTQMQLPLAAINRVVARIKILGKLDIADRLRPQDGRARIQVSGKPFDLRISSVPTRDAEKIVIRVLDPENSPTFEKLGLSQQELARIRQLLGFRDGIVAVTGPTGSGKTTTLYAGIRQLATGKVNIMTVEDPVEFELGSISQIQVDVKRGVTFASALRAILRQDPDVIFVGEIRDEETAETAVHAAMTGHLVLASLHTNDAVGAVPRLVDLGLSPASVAGSLRGVIAQRLMRRACEDCKVPIGELTEAEKDLSRRYQVQASIRAIGCRKCGHSGYRGRMAIAEAMAVTPPVADAISRGADVATLQRAAVAAGMRPMKEVAVAAVRDGITTLEELDRVIGETSTEAPSAETPEVAAVEQAARVLVVDDDEVVRSLARTFLESAGYRVVEASDGKAALDLLAIDDDVSLTLVDLDMPGMKGFEVLKQLRATPATVGMPAIVLTASDHPDDEIMAMDTGADDYIRKPIDPARLIARVKAVLRRAGS